MSLICGILSRENPDVASAEALELMMSVSGHRARGGRETFVDPAEGIAVGYCHTATFAQRKDVPSGHEDDAFVAAVDGDIYDTASHLRERASSFKSPHAGAVVASFEQNAEAFPSALDGIFSLFLWDRSRKVLYLSSDPMDHKLVYFYEAPELGLLVFSTELKGVLAHPAVPRGLDQRGLALNLGISATPAPLTPAKNVRKLRAAECRIYTSEETQSRRYWRASPESGPEDLEHWVKRARSESLRATEQAVGGVSGVGVLLSGGIDSSVILAALKENGVSNTLALTLAFKGHESEYEIQWAERVAKAVNSPQRTLLVDAEAEVTPELMSRLMRQIDEPFEAGSRVVGEYFLMQAASEAGFDSILSGGTPLFAMDRVRRMKNEGSLEPALAESRDEALRVLFGPPKYMNAEQMNRALKQPADLSGWDEAALANRDLLEGLEDVPALSLAARLRVPLNRTSLFYQYIPPLLGCDERTPYLDTQIASFIVSVPPNHRGLESGENRLLLQGSFGDQLGIDFKQREQRGFPGLPLPGWLQRMLIPSLEVLVNDGIIKGEYMAWLEKNAGTRRKRVDKEAWQWFVFNCWYQYLVSISDEGDGPIRGSLRKP